MVLQSGAAVPIWGKAAAGEAVTVEFAGQSKSTQAGPDGSWRVELDPMEPSAEPREMKISGRPPIQGVLVGDVWVCIGDQNMMLAPKKPQPDNTGENALIRHYVGRGGESPTPLQDFSLPSFWALTDAKGMGQINAVAHGFASAIQQKAGVPIGIINQATHQGASLLAYLPTAAHKHLPKDGPMAELRSELESLDPASESGNKTLKAYREAVAAWKSDAAARIAKGEFPLPMPKSPGADTTVAKAYNALVHPIAGFPVKGFVFVLHDRTNSTVDATSAQLQALVSGIRDAFKNPQLPFFIGGFHNPGAADEDPNRFGSVAKWGEAARRLIPVLPMTGVAVGSDLGAPGSYASLKPQELGRRLGLLANRQVYGDTSSVASGPMLKAHEVKDGKMVLTFDSVGSGLDSEGALGGFAIAGADKKFHWAKATIVGNTVELSAPEVPTPEAARYDAANFSNGSRLRNKEGLPAVPFAIGFEQ